VFLKAKFLLMNSNKRVVVTGIGATTPLGLNVSETWKNLIAGVSGVSQITLFDTKDCPVKIAAEVKNFDVTAPFSKPLTPFPHTSITQVANAKEARKMGRFIHLGLSAALQAYDDSGLDEIRAQLDPERIGANIGAGMGGLPEIESVHLDLVNKGYKRVTPFLIPQIIPNMVAGQLSILLGLKGPNLCNVTACTSSAHSLGESYYLIQRGDADIMIAGGAESVISPLGIGGFAAMRALSQRNEDPTRASRPFDKDRDGFVMGEGGAVLVLEEYEHAKKRNAKIYGEILGYGLSSDAYHMTSPSPNGEGGMRAMKMALKKANLDPSKVDYINAHGTSTPAGDTEEAAAVAKLMGDSKSKLHMSSTKSMTGHLLGAAGALETLICLLSMRDGVIPPTINLNEADEACKALELNLTPNEAVKKPVHYALSNSFGFGGTNASIVVGKV